MGDKDFQEVALWYAQNNAKWASKNGLEEHYRIHLEIDSESMVFFLERMDTLNHYLSLGIKNQEIELSNEEINFILKNLKKFISLVIIELKKIFPFVEKSN